MPYIGHALLLLTVINSSLTFGMQARSPEHTSNPRLRAGYGFVNARCSSVRNTNMARQTGDSDEMSVSNGHEEVSSDGATGRNKISSVAETEEESLKLERQEMRLSGLESYVFISVLTATSSFSTIEKRIQTMDADVNFWLEGTFLLTSSLSTLFGVYSTVVFALCVLYGKTAIGMERDDTYSYFMDTTGLQRLRGFQAFSASVLLFGVEVLLEVGEKVPSQIRIPTAIASFAILTFAYKEWKFITDAAVPIFTGKIPDGNDKGS